MIYVLLMTAGILEFIFALLLAVTFFDMEAEKEAEYQEAEKEAEYQEGYAEGYIDGYAEGHIDGKSDQIALELKWNDAEYYDALVDEANCWFGIEGD